jgi:cbb3-type cytochrome oxidase subunit 3
VGPLRDSDIALFAGFLSTIGLIIILTLGLTIWCSIFWPKKIADNDLQTKKLGINLKVDFLLVHAGSAGFAFVSLSILLQLNN